MCPVEVEVGPRATPLMMSRLVSTFQDRQRDRPHRFHHRTLAQTLYITSPWP